MIIGSHVVIYSRDSAADRAFLRDVLKLPYVDVGGGWLIFGLPPSEIAFHLAEGTTSHEFYLMCQDVQAFTRQMQRRAIEVEPISEQRWGLLTHLTLPGGARVGVYEPRHPRPQSASATTARRARSKRKRSAKSRTRRATAGGRRARPK
jgi:hypothetical protein